MGCGGDTYNERRNACRRVNHHATRVINSSPVVVFVVRILGQPATAPNPVRCRIVHEHRPDYHELASAEEMKFFRPSPSDEHWHHQRKCHLKRGEQQVWNRLAWNAVLHGTQSVHRVCAELKVVAVKGWSSVVCCRVGIGMAEHSA